MRDGYKAAGLSFAASETAARGSLSLFIFPFGTW